MYFAFTKSQSWNSLHEKQGDEEQAQCFYSCQGLEANPFSGIYRTKRVVPGTRKLHSKAKEAHCRWTIWV